MRDSQRKKIVVIGPGNSIVVKGFYNNILKSECDFTLITNKLENKNDYDVENITIIEMDDIWGYDRKLQSLGDAIADQYIKEKGKPDACIIQYSHFGTIHSFHKIWKSSKRRILTFWGSDFYLLPENRRKLMRRFIFESTKIVCVVSTLRKAIEKQFSPFFRYKTRVIDFGMNLYEELIEVQNNISKEECKKEYGFPLDKHMIHVGYSSSEHQNHTKLIESLRAFPEELKKECFIVVPFPFNNDEDYKSKVEKVILESGIEGQLQLGELVKFDNAKFRNTADVFLYGQTTDGGSQSVLEYAFMGTKVVMDKKLYPNYEVFKKTKYDVSTFETTYDISSIISEYLYNKKEPRNLDDLKHWLFKNKTWKEIKRKWAKLL